ncbi:MAG: amino acid adenylation domain-containing protein, partial [Chloroflexi bacterium]|nr:amino acid adenylation domain-containing protein [Chloroflexota bacterium]
YSGIEDIVVGAPVTGRVTEELNSLIGCFANLLLFRTDLRGNPDFREVLRRIRHGCVQVYKHQDVPFGRIVEELRPTRALSYTPLVQLLFSLEEFPEARAELPDIETVDRIDLPHDTAKFDLSFIVRDTGDELRGYVEFDTDLFDSTTIGRMLAHFETMLVGVVADPGCPITRLPLLSQAERHQAIVGWNATGAAYPSQTCVHNLIEARAAEDPQATAVSFDRQLVSYEALNARANQLAHHLRDLGVGADTLVGVCLHQTPDLIVTLLAVLKAGAAYVPLDPGYPLQRLAFMLRDTSAPMVVTRQELLPRLPAELPGLVCLDLDSEGIARRPAHNPTPASNPADRAYVMYTSGSTGTPKGVVVTHRNLVHSTSARMAYYGDRVTRFLLLSSFAFDSSVAGVFWTLCDGADLVLPPPGLARDPESLAHYIVDEQISHTLLIPSLYSLTLDGFESRRPVGLRTVIVAGEPCPTDLPARHSARLPGVKLFNEYGPTEATVWTTVHECDDIDMGGSVPIGRPISNVQVYLLDRDGNVVPIGMPGELLIGGDGVARGYLRQPELTTERFVPNPFSGLPGARLYRTGDLARYRSDGTLEFVGRLDRQIKLRGYRIEPGEIETTLRAHPTILDAAVVRRDDVPTGPRLVAYVVAERDRAVDERELRAFVRTRLPEYMVPATVVVLDALPVSANGKVDNASLPAPGAASVQGVAPFIAARTDVEAGVAAIWAEVLGLERVSVDANFFDLGGHSMLASQVIARVRSAFRVNVPLRRMFEAPTVAGIADSVEALSPLAQSLQLPALVRKSVNEASLLSIAQEQFWALEQRIPNTPFFNINATVRLTGELNVDALQSAFDTVVRRHEILRTCYEKEDGRARLRVSAPAPFELQIVDLSALPEDQRAASLAQQLALCALRPFDLAHAPLMRAVLARLRSDQHVLAVTLHHIVADGWSMDVLTQEVQAIYGASLAGDLPHLPELPIQYADFAAWQRALLEGEFRQILESFWKSELIGNIPRLEFPRDRARGKSRTFQYGSRELVLAEPLYGMLGQLSRRDNATLFMLLLASLEMVLYSYTGQRNFGICILTGNRAHVETEPLIGLFVNTLVLPADLTGDPRFSELLRRVRDTTTRAYDHQDLPFEQVVHLLKVAGADPSECVPRVLVTFETARGHTPELPGIVASDVERTDNPLAETLVSTYELIVEGEERDNQVALRLKFDVDLFEAATIEAMLGRLRSLIERVALGHDERISALCSCTPIASTGL